MSTSVLRERSCASSRMMTLYRSKSPSFNDSLRSTPSVISISIASVKSSPARKASKGATHT